MNIYSNKQFYVFEITDKFYISLITEKIKQKTSQW